MTKPSITEAFPPMEMEKLCWHIKNFPELPPQQQNEFVSELVKVHPVLSIDWPGQELFRIRAISPSSIISSVDDVIWPKTANTTPGRLHVDGHPVFYLASSRETALRETDVEDSMVALASFGPIPSVSMEICPIGEITQIVRTGRGIVIKEKEAASIKGFIEYCPRQKAKAICIADAFLYELLTSERFEYACTSLVSQAIFRKNDAVDAFVYPSCKQRFGYNIAIRRDRFWAKYGVTSVSRANAKHLASGFYNFSDTEQVEGIYNSGSFLWAKGQAQNESRLLLDPAWRPSSTL